MKTKTVFVLLCFIVGLITSCSTTTTSIDNQNNTINGSWHLKNVSGGLMGINIDYQPGDVKWTFDTTTNTLAVENTIITTGPEDLYAGLDTGTYTYEIQVEETTQTLYINNVARGSIQLENNYSTLTIDDGVAADGMMTTFIR